MHFDGASQTASRAVARETTSMNPKPVEPNNDDEVDTQEIEAAADERVTPDTAPEVNSKTQNLTEWDQPAPTSPDGASKTPFDEETTIAEQLVEEGIDEADRELRIASADPDFEP